MEEIPSRGAESRSATQEIPAFNEMRMFITVLTIARTVPTPL